jgi:copper resistance protein B
MIKKILLILFTASLSLSVFASEVDDDPLLTKVMISQLETRLTGGSKPAAVLDAQAWIGKDLHKLWLKTDVEQLGKNIEEVEFQALYSRAVAPYWDFQLGWRTDIRPQPNRNWAVIGFQGLAPYWFEIEATAFIGDDGRTAVRLEAEYEVLLTQRLILTPDFEVNAYGKNDAATGIGAGVSNLELGLRLRYEIRREFAPYIGVNWVKKFGQTAHFARDEGEGTDDVQFVAGVRVWF